VNNIGWWKRDVGDINKMEIMEWNPKNAPYARGSMVLYNQSVFIAQGDKNSGLPGTSTDQIISIFYTNPDKTLFFVLGLHGVILVVQVLFLWLQPEYDWKSVFVLILINLYIFYLILWCKKEIYYKIKPKLQ
jgi:hypothetical protein